MLHFLVNAEPVYEAHTLPLQVEGAILIDEPPTQVAGIRTKTSIVVGFYKGVVLFVQCGWKFNIVVSNRFLYYLPLLNLRQCTHQRI